MLQAQAFLRGRVIVMSVRDCALNARKVHVQLGRILLRGRLRLSFLEFREEGHVDAQVASA